MYNLHRDTSFNGLLGSVELSTKSDMLNCVPSTSFTTQVSDLGPDSSTMEMDLDDVLRIISNSSEVTDGMSAAFTDSEIAIRGADRIPERMARL